MAFRRFFALVLGVTLFGCQNPTEGGDAGSADGAPAACAIDSDCDDGVFCNGPERCREDDAGTLQCVPGNFPCGVGTFCDEATDRCELTCTTDADNDGSIARECGGPDCDDADPLRHPGNPEVCDAAHVDEDCDATTFGNRDVDGDGWTDARCCNRIGDTLRCGEDCDDDDPGVHRTASEVCDGFDNDCDGEIDERVSYRLWPDADRDGFGDREATSMLACTFMPGFALVGDDCDDALASTNPGTHDVCNGVDDDCDGIVDEGAATRCADASGVTDAACVHLGGEAAPRCVVTRCAAEHLDCNLDPSDGCEANFCDQIAHCGACGGYTVGCGSGYWCNNGRCAPSGASASAAIGIITRASNRAPIAGARVSRLRECGGPMSVTSGLDGRYELVWYYTPPFQLVRTEATGYATQVNDPLSWDRIRLLETTELEALLALSPVPVNRSLGIVVVDAQPNDIEVVEPVSGTFRAPSIPSAPRYEVPLGDGRARVVFVNVRPGTVRVRTSGAMDLSVATRCADPDDPGGPTTAPIYYDTVASGDGIVHLQFGECWKIAVGG